LAVDRFTLIPDVVAFVSSDPEQSDQLNTGRPGPLLDLTVESVAFGGKGVARHEGKVWFVADAVTGDRVSARVVKDGKRYGDAGIEEFVARSTLRGPSPCAWSETCGGCQWQGIDYAQQLEWKRSFVVTALQRIGRVEETDLSFPIHGSPNVLGFRNRILVRARAYADGRVEAGYFRRGSRELVPIGRCAIAGAEINRFLEWFLEQRFPGEVERRWRMEIQEVHEAQAFGSHQSSKVIVTIHPAEMPCADLEPVRAALQASPMVAWTGFNFEIREAPDFVFDVDADAGRNAEYVTRPGMFQQVNVAHNHLLRRLVRQAVDATRPARILDVFCGSGNLSLQLADGVRWIEGVEFDSRAIDVARKSAERGGLARTTWIATDATKHLWKYARSGVKFDLVIADPPREGMFEAIIPLAKIAPQRIVYVSCDPGTMARDVGSLIRQGYRIAKIDCLDFFPNTWHVETILVLDRVVEGAS